MQIIRSGGEMICWHWLYMELLFAGLGSKLEQSGQKLVKDKDISHSRG